VKGKRSLMKAELGTFPKDRQILHEIVPLDTPLSIDIHMHHYCNFKCNYCAMSMSSKQLEKTVYKSGSMDMELFSLVVKQLKEFPKKIKMITIEGVGEATIHPHIVDMVKLLHDSGVTDKIQIITNGSMLNPEFNEALVNAGLGELRISLQGLSERKYLEIADASINWNEYYENICHFSRVRKTCALKVKIVDTALEDGDEEKFFALFGNICDAVSIEHIYNPWTQNGVDIDIKTIGQSKSRYGREAVDLKVCRRVFTSIDILPDGMLTQTCHDRFGFEKNIKEATIAAQWNSSEFDMVRIDMLNGKKDQWEFCKKCVFINATWHPEDVLDGHEKDILNRMKK